MAVKGAKPIPTYTDGDVPKFSMPVDSEHKAKAIHLFSLKRPHMLAFHLNWLGFFITFLSAYAAAPLIDIIRDSVGLHQFEANLAGMPRPSLACLSTELPSRGACGPAVALGSGACMHALNLAAVCPAHTAAEQPGSAPTSQR